MSDELNYVICTLMIAFLLAVVWRQQLEFTKERLEVRNRKSGGSLAQDVKLQIQLISWSTLVPWCLIMKNCMNRRNAELSN